jgi:hypothetical protein
VRGYIELEVLGNDGGAGNLEPRTLDVGSLLQKMRPGRARRISPPSTSGASLPMPAWRVCFIRCPSSNRSSICGTSALAPASRCPITFTAY